MRLDARRLVLFVTAAGGVAACSLFTDFGGATGGDDDDADAAASAEGGGSDGAIANDGRVPGSGLDGASDDATVIVDPDGGDSGLPNGLLTKDDFDTSCASWKTYNATAELVTDAFAGAGACRVCLVTSGVAGGLARFFKNVPPGRYVVTTRVKNESAQDFRFTIVRTIDGGAESHYHTVPFVDDAWTLASTSTRGETLEEVNLWFGDQYQAGNCVLVDDLTVSRDP